jgi:hypothetical protein
MMEWWNNGMVFLKEVIIFLDNPFKQSAIFLMEQHPNAPKPNNPSFHYSNIPIMSEAN